MELNSSIAAVVTGGASGLGEATARALAKHGIKVAIFDMQKDKGETVAVDQTLAEAIPQDFDALMIPGGLMNHDALRSSEEALEFVRHFSGT